MQVHVPQIPAVAWPFPKAQSPHVPDVTELTHEWSVAHGLLPADAPTGDLWAYPEGTCRMFPGASLQDSALACQWFIWITVLDDHHDFNISGQSWPSIERDIARVLEARGDLELPSDAGPLARALADLCRRTLCRLSDAWKARFARHVAGFVAAAVESSDHATTPDVATYVPMRHDSTAAWVFMSLIEFVERIEIPPALFVMPDFQDIYRAANDVIGWFNDMHSVAKEAKVGQDHNMVTVLQAANGYDLATAVQVTHDLIEARLGSLEAAIDTLPPVMRALRLDASARADVQRIIDRYGYFITGHAGWYDDTDRYTRPLAEPGPIPGYVYDISASGAVPRA